MTKPHWLLDLEENGYTVVKGVVPKEHCKEFQEAGLTWLESFPHGFKRDDRSTWDAHHLPYGVTGGLYNRYAVNHEDFVWKIRAEPGILKVFSEIWGTDDLIASFDGINASLPVNAKTGRTDISPTAPWPHCDQNLRRLGHELYQGIANLSENGPDDGGLCVMAGSHKLHKQFLEETGGIKEKQDAGVNENSYMFSKEDAEWYRAHGCKEVKICAGEGDLILWDSLTMHWNSSPVGDRTRFISYVCYAPRSYMSEQDLAKKLDVFSASLGTTHWPHKNIIPEKREGYHNALPRRPDDSVDPANRSTPLNPPARTEAVMRLVGVRA